MNSYPLNGADRFQLFFDSVARKNTGTGNVIRAAITVNGILPEKDFLTHINQNETISFLLGLSLEKKWYSVLYRFEQKNSPVDLRKIISFHESKSQEEAFRQALSRDCSFFSGSPIYIDVIYGPGQTHIIFSASHVLMDYAGMENLLSSFSETKIKEVAPQYRVTRKSFFLKMREAIQSTLFVGSISGWRMKHLPKKSSHGNPVVELLELSVEETAQTKLRLSDEIKTNSLSFFLGCTLYSLDSLPDFLSPGMGNYFVAVPVDRRPTAKKNVILSNFLSFIYFHAKPAEVKSVKNISQNISLQMISQARKSLPEKFSSLLDLFRFIPAPVYRAFIDLPSNGHSGTFAFSLLTNSLLENKSFLGLPVTDVTHYAPVISPPGLNIVFNEFCGRLKIILSFDESRISKLKARELLQTIRKNLLD